MLMVCPGAHPSEKGLYLRLCVFEYFIAVIHDKWFSSHHSTNLCLNNFFIVFLSYEDFFGGIATT